MRSLLVFAALALAAASSMGCGTPQACKTLEDTCSKCRDPGTRDLCLLDLETSAGAGYSQGNFCADANQHYRDVHRCR